jgi:hypothetical protein
MADRISSPKLNGGVTVMAGPHPAGLRPETAVGRSFRCGMHAVRSGERAHWARAWQELASTGRGVAVDGLQVRLAVFVETIEATAVRRIDILPAGCPGLCRDECLAVSIIAASQLGACPALRACAFALLETPHMDGPLRAATEFAKELRDAGYHLSPQSVCNSAALMAISSSPRN